MKVLIWGAGAIGGTLGAYFIRAGHEVRFVDLDEDHVAALNRSGLRIEGPIDTFTVPAQAFSPDTLQGRYRTVLLCTKAHHTERATRMLAAHLAPAGYVVSVQNGLNEEVVAGILGAERVVGAFVNFAAAYLEPGVNLYAGRGAVVVGELTGEISDRALELQRLFLTFDDETLLSSNILGFLWSKLSYGLMLFATALTNTGVADLFGNPRYQRLFGELAREVLRVAVASGIDPEPFDRFDPTAFLPDVPFERALASLNAMVAFNTSTVKPHTGIWRDLAIRKRKTEVDALLGPICSYGTRVGVATPLTAAVIGQIHDIEAGDRPMEETNLDELGRLLAP